MKTFSRAKVELLLKKENEVWLYSYADLITNLLAFFLLLLVVSKSDAGTVQKVQQSIGKTFGYSQIPTDTDYLNVVTEFLRDSELKNHIAIQKTVEGASLTFSGGLFFETASPHLTSKAREILDGLSPLLVKLPKKFRFDIEGHADARPMTETDQFASNWELSAARAGSVVRYLGERGIQSNRMRAIGYAATQPISSDHDQNRRVVIKIGKGTL